MGKALVVALAVLAVASGAYADLVSPSFNFSGGANSFNASLQATGSATLSGSGTYYSWVGWPVSSYASVSINLPSQSFGLGTNPDPINISKNPMGNAQISFDNGANNHNTNTLKNGVLNSLNITDMLGGSPQGLALNPITLSGEISGIGIPVDITLNASGSISNFSLTSAPGNAWMLGHTGAYPSIAYNFLSSPSTAGVNYHVGVAGNLSIWGILNIDLGQLTSLDGHLDYAGVPLMGSMILTELPGPYPRSVHSEIAVDLSQWTPVTVPISTTGSYDFNNYTGGSTYYKVHFDYGFNGSLTVNNIGLDINGTIANIIPEPITVAVFGVGAGLLSLARRRGRK